MMIRVRLLDTHGRLVGHASFRDDAIVPMLAVWRERTFVRDDDTQVGPTPAYVFREAKALQIPTHALELE